MGRSQGSNTTDSEACGPILAVNSSNGVSWEPMYILSWNVIMRLSLSCFHIGLYIEPERR